MKKEICLFEKAAKSAYEAITTFWPEDGFPPSNWDTASFEDRQKANRIARAVLMAVKDPDTEIVDEGLKQWSNLRDMFDAMIDAILAEGE